MERLIRVIRRVAYHISEHHLTIIAGGIAYNAIFALFPGLAALVSVYGLVADPATVAQQVQALRRLLPGDASNVIGQELNKLISSSGSRLGISFVVSLLLSLYSVAGGIESLITGINIAYGAKETRGFLKLWAVGLVLAIGGVFAAVLVLGLIAVVPVLLSFLPLSPQVTTLLSLLRWPLLAVLSILGLSVVYRWGAASRPGARWRWITWGSATCTVLWMIGSGMLSVYVSNFGKYDQTYGSIGGAIVLLLWLYLSAFTVLLGAEVDADLEEMQPDPRATSPAKMESRHVHSEDQDD